ncbi:hypothetical protein [Streptomyces sp. 4F14]|uniref:hypothetical protein n=1 Tax=Streptomyces sp. 4F14 TaxID=3394380 RepID=UPI003A8A5B67
MSDELSRALHELASANETPPAVSGPQIRARAVRRTRRRTAVALGASAAAVALLAVGLTRGGDEPGPRDRPPAAAPASSAAPTTSAPPSLSPSPSPSNSIATAVPAGGSIDLTARTLTVGGRVMKLGSGFDNSPTVKGPLTVREKPGSRTLTVTNGADGTRYNAVISSVVLLLDADRRPVYIGASDSYNADAIGTHETADGWLALDRTDAKWFYGEAQLGAVLSVEP